MRNNSRENFGLLDYTIIALSYTLFALTLPISIWLSIKIVNEYERAVIFRLGCVLKKTRGPGLVFVLPCVDNWTIIDIRTKSVILPKKEILTYDSVVIEVVSICYYRVNDPIKAVTNIDDFENSILLLASLTLRTVLAAKSLDVILQDINYIQNEMQELSDQMTVSWGIKIERIDIKDIKLPEEIQSSMAIEAISERQARSTEISCKSEKDAFEALTNATDTLNENRVAISLRLLM